MKALRQLAFAAFATAALARAAAPCMITVVEKESGWPVPLVELRSTHHARLVTDNAGVIALDLPELMGHEIWFDIIGHGYGVQPDGFGKRGVRLLPRSGATLRVEVERSIIARRLGRLTGGGILAESQRLGLESAWRESGELGCDSVQSTAHNGRRFWLWGDTTLANYPLGVFHTTGAWSALTPFGDFTPPLRVVFEHFRDQKASPRAIARLPGPGPTWLSGLVSLPDREGKAHLCAVYSKITPPLEPYETGLCLWNEASRNFERVLAVWRKDENKPRPATPHGHAARWRDAAGMEWLLFGDPLPHLRCPATLEAWRDPAAWERLEPQRELVSLDGQHIRPHSGSIAWNAFRKRWVTIFMQHFGQPSVFGELWYAEADTPLGPWGKAVKVLSHDNYTFYNPCIHAEATPADATFLLFEGTYTTQFADNPCPTPRYEYTQILYRLDLDDPRLAPAH